MYDLDLIRGMDLEPTTRCNASCATCPRNIAGGKTRPGLNLTELTLADIVKILPVSMVKRLFHMGICGSYGDPSIARDMVPIISWLHANSSGKLFTAMHTNGGARPPSFWRELAGVLKRGSGRGQVIFSVDGLADTNHIYRRGVDWERLEENMRAYSEAGGEASWEYLVFRHNEHQVEEARALATRLKMRFFPKRAMGFDFAGELKPVRVYDREGRYDYTIYAPGMEGPDLEKDFLNTTVPDFVRGGWEPELSPRLFPHEDRLARETTISCKYVRDKHQQFYLSAEGYVFPCCFVGSGYMGGVDYGRVQLTSSIQAAGAERFNAFHRPLEEILLSSEMRTVFEESWAKKSAQEGRLLYCAEFCGEKNVVDKTYEPGALQELGQGTRPDQFA